MKKIPKKIHFIWFGNEEPNIPYLSNVEEMYKDFEIKIWKEEDFNLDSVCEFVKFAKQNKKWDYLSDYFKMKVLYEEGGIYLENDMEPVKKFKYKSSAELFVGYEYRNSLTTGFIASTPGHKFTKSIMEYYESLTNPGFFPSRYVVWTEILYSLYPELKFSNVDKKVRDLQTLNRKAFALRREPRVKEGEETPAYFLHRHTVHYEPNKFLKEIKDFYAKVERVTPGLVENIKANYVKRKTDSYSKQLTKPYQKKVIVVEDRGYLTKKIFDNIVAQKYKVDVHLIYKNIRLAKMIEKIYNVDKVTFGPTKSRIRYNDENLKLGNTNVELKPGDHIVEFKPTKFRNNLETYTNMYHRLFQNGAEGIMLHFSKLSMLYSLTLDRYKVIKEQKELEKQHHAGEEFE